MLYVQQFNAIDSAIDEINAEGLLNFEHLRLIDEGNLGTNKKQLKNFLKTNTAAPVAWRFTGLAVDSRAKADTGEPAEEIIEKFSASQSKQPMQQPAAAAGHHRAASMPAAYEQAAAAAGHRRAASMPAAYEQKEGEEEKHPLSQFQPPYSRNSEEEQHPLSQLQPLYNSSSRQKVVPLQSANAASFAGHESQAARELFMVSLTLDASAEMLERR